MNDPGGLLSGPRGRRFCLELARAVALASDTAAARQYLEAAFWAAHHLDPGRGISRVILRSADGDDTDPLPTPRPEEVARLLAAVPVHPVSDVVLTQALAAAVDAARYWQQPDGEDVLAATGPVRGALARVADEVAVSGRTAWWSTPLDRSRQWTVSFDAPASPTPTPPTAAAERLARWRADVVHEEDSARRERPADARAPWSGTWWSTPPAELLRTTRSRDEQGPIGLWAVEDRFSWDGAVVSPVTVPGAAHVYELDGPQAWAHLCRRYPLEVTASRRHDWYRTTGRTGGWVIPDWSRAAQDYDAVHLTVTGYLRTAGRAITVTADACSVLAGWNPDLTYWLSDDAPGTGTRQAWVRRDDDTWHQEAP